MAKNMPNDDGMTLALERHTRPLASADESARVPARETPEGVKRREVRRLVEDIKVAKELGLL